MNRWRVGEDRGSKETDGCPLTTKFEQFCCPQLISTKVNYSHVTLLNGNAINKVM
jgi:hypothetical protein